MDAATAQDLIDFWTAAGPKLCDFSFLSMGSLEPALSTPEGVAVPFADSYWEV